MDKIINDNIPKNIMEKVIQISSLLNTFIEENLNNLKLIEMKLLQINNYIQKLITKEKEHFNVLNIEVPTIKKKSRVTSAIAPNRSKYYSINYKDIDFNNKKAAIAERINKINIKEYTIMKLKKKLKEENEKHKLRELEYLETIALIQYKLQLYESDLKKFFIVYNNKPKKSQNKSFREIIPNNNENHNKKRIYKSISFYGKSSSNKNNVFSNYNFGESNEYFPQPLIKLYPYNYSNYFKSKSKKSFSSMLELSYKYQTGNSYIKNNFRKIKKEVKENLDKIEQLKINHNFFVNYMQDKSDKEYKKKEKI